MSESIFLVLTVACAVLFWLAVVAAVIAVSRLRRGAPGASRWVGVLGASVVGFAVCFNLLSTALGD